MSKIGLSYGSEWHMLRMLGWHREWFTQQVLDVTKGTGLLWQDFDFTARTGESSNYGDAETKGLNFLPIGHSAREAWQSWWPQSGNVHNWDAVGLLESGGSQEWLLVESKGHTDELRSYTSAKSEAEGGGSEQIRKRLAETQEALGSTGLEVWTEPYYQYANRLALLHFLKQQGVASRLVFVYFTGDTTRGRKCPTSVEEWRPPLAAMKQHLGLTARSTLEQRVHEVFLPVGGSP